MKKSTVAPAIIAITMMMSPINAKAEVGCVVRGGNTECTTSTVAWLNAADGGFYKGQYKNGKYHGKGELKFEDGSVYEGEFKNGKRDGKGKFIITSHSGMESGMDENGVTEEKFKITQDVYEGDWKNDMPNGKGKLTKGEIIEVGESNGILFDNITEGFVFEGRFKNGKYEGK